MTAPASIAPTVTQADRDAFLDLMDHDLYDDPDIGAQFFAHHRGSSLAALLKAAEDFLDFFENNADEAAIGEEVRLQANLRAEIAKARGGVA